MREISQNIKGISIEIGGNITPLQKALGNVNAETRSLQSELKGVETLLKLDPKNVDLLQQRQDLLNQSMSETKDKLELLSKTKANIDSEMASGTEYNQKEYRNLVREIAATEQSLGRLESQSIKAQAVLSKDDAAKNLKNIATAASAAGLAIGAALGGSAIKAGQVADDLNTLSKQTGLTTKQLQIFQFASDRIDVSMDTLTGSMSKLTKNMSNARNGSKNATEAFEKLGVSFKDNVTGELRNNQDVFEEAIKALGEIENSTERDALAMELFGKSAQDLNPLILGGADALKQMGIDAEELGLILSQDALDAANEFQDGLDEIKAIGAGMFLNMGVEVAKKLTPYLKELIEILKVMPRWIEENQVWLKILGVVIGTITALIIAFNIQQYLLASGMTLWTAAAGLATTATTILGTAVAFLTSPIGIIILAIGALIAAILLLKKYNEEIKEFLSETWDSIQGIFSEKIQAIQETFAFAWYAISKAFSAFGKLFKGDFKGFLNEIWQYAKTWVLGWADIGKNIVSGIWEGISGMASWLAEKVTGFFGSVVDAAKSAVGINSPSTVFRDEVGKNMALGVGVGFTDTMEAVKMVMSDSLKKSSSEIYTDNRINNNSEIKLTQNIYTPVKNERALAKEAERNFRKILVSV